MAISSDDTPRKTYLGDDSTDTYAYDWKITDKAHLALTILNEDGEEVDLVVDTDYAVTGVGDADGGTIVLDDGNLSDGSTLLIGSAVPYTQPTVLPRQGSWDPKTIEGRLDALVRQIQQLREIAGRALTVSVFDDVLGLLPPAAERAGKIFAFDEDGNPRVVTNIEGFDGTAEEAARIAADGVNAAAILAEAGTRAADDLTLSGLIDSEAIARADADAELQPLDADLTAIAAAGTQAFGISLLGAADAAAALALLGTGVAADDYASDLFMAQNFV